MHSFMYVYIFMERIISPNAIRGHMHFRVNVIEMVVSVNLFFLKQVSYVCVCMNIIFPFALDVNKVFREMLLFVSTSPGQCVIFLIFGLRAFVLRPGIHFTHKLWVYIGNLMKSIIVLIFTLTIQSSHISANGTIAQLYVQTSNMMGASFSCKSHTYIYRIGNMST